MVPDEEKRALAAIRRAATTVPFYVKQALGERLADDAPLADVLARLPLLGRDKLRATLPKAWFPEGRDAKAELAQGAIAVVEAGTADTRVRILFDAKAFRAQERRALAIHPRAAEVLAGGGPEAVLWVPERGTGSCGSGDPEYEDRLEGARLHLNSRQDPTFWTEPVMTRMLDELERHRTEVLLADPFYLDVLARHAAVSGRRLPVLGFVATTRARATAAHRAMLRRVFSGTTVDLYGAREVGTLFVEGADGKMHHASQATHVELLRAKVETPGASDVALVVVTTLERDVQPLVRYVLGDLVQVAGPSTIASVEGALDDAIVRPDGAIVTAGAIDRAVGPGPRGYQAVQVEPGAVEVEVVDGSVPALEEALATLLAGMRVTVRTATAIGVEANGKYRTTRRRVPLDPMSAFEETGR